MPSLKENKKIWKNYDWSQQGEEWSINYGGSNQQWKRSIYPRIKEFIPVNTILEIAPGYGRITQYLIPYGKNMILVDICPNCIEACKSRFSKNCNITYHVNDGMNLEMIPDNCIDFVFSFDSLVHVESDVIHIYLSQLSKKMKLNAVGWIHHSNAGNCSNLTYEFLKKLHLSNIIPKRYKSDAQRHMRSRTMTAKKFEEHCEKSNLQCINQEIISWGGGESLIDCFSTFTRKGSKWDKPNEVFINKNFMKAVAIKQMSNT